MLGWVVCRVEPFIRSRVIVPGDLVELKTNLVVGESGYGRMSYFHRGGVYFELPSDFDSTGSGHVEALGSVESGLINDIQVNKVSKYRYFVWRPHKETFTYVLINASKSAKRLLASFLPGDAGSIAAGMMFGGDEGISVQMRNLFRNVGVSHILSASGYNVIVVAGVVMAMATPVLGKRLAIWIGMVCDLLYVVLAGATPAVIRAGLMVGLGLAGKLIGRKSEGLWGLFVVVVVMLFASPQLIVDVGFQLSVTATAGILFFSGTSEGLWGSWKTTLAATMATIPVVVWHFERLSLWSPAVNVLIGWTVPGVMAIGAVALGVGIISRELGNMIMYLAWPLLSWFSGVVTWAADLPGANLEVHINSVWWVVFYYATLVLVVWYWKRRHEESL